MSEPDLPEPIATAAYVLDREHFERVYDDWLATRSRYRKRQAVIGVLLLGVGALLLFAFDQRPLGICLTVFGLTELLGALLRLHRRSTIASWMKGPSAGRRVLVRFRESEVEIEGESSRMRASWSMVEPTQGGLRIRCVPRAVVFVPRECVIPVERYEDLVRRCGSLS